MKSKALITLFFIATVTVSSKAQNSTFSPFSRYGIGEMAQPTFAHNAGMGGAHIALRSDSTMPIFVNVGNPASYAFIRLTTLEVGGTYMYSIFKGSNNSSLRKWGTNFSYGALGVPIRRNGGACFGIMPLSYVGYETQNQVSEENVGDVLYKFAGDGGLNKAFIGYGLLPFDRRLVRFRTKHLNLPDSIKSLSHKQYLRREKLSKIVNDFSLGFNVNYVFGSIVNTTRVVYPNSLIYNNTFRERILTLGDFTGNFGAQTATSIDSITDRKGRKRRIDAAIAELGKAGISGTDLVVKSDSIRKYTPLHNRALRQKVKFTFGFFMNLNNDLKASYTSGVYNYILNGSGQEIIRDTAFYNINQKGTVRLPLEQGFGIGFKKGERLNLVADFAFTNWQNFKYLDQVNDLKNNYRLAAGMNFVPEKYNFSRGSFFRRVNYRLGVSYQTGSIFIKNTYISEYAVSAGVGIPVGVGRLSSMVNISGQYGRLGSGDPSLLKQNYWRVNFGFTFCDKWFRKYAID